MIAIMAAVLIIVVAVLIIFVPPIVGLIGGIVGWGTFFGSYYILKPYIPNKGVRILILILWIGAYLSLAIKAVLAPDPPDFGYTAAATATFWIPAIIILIVYNRSKSN